MTASIRTPKRQLVERVWEGKIPLPVAVNLWRLTASWRDVAQAVNERLPADVQVTHASLHRWYGGAG